MLVLLHVDNDDADSDDDDDDSAAGTDDYVSSRIFLTVLR